MCIIAMHIALVIIVINNLPMRNYAVSDINQRILKMTILSLIKTYFSFIFDCI